jgi:endogenous inhibitor of DNA gyrase (YacG/DUF329 family)
MSDKAADLKSDKTPGARPCPICGKPPTIEMRPFCSKRCADVDLHRWLGGTYAIPAVEKDEEDSPDAEGDV